MEHIIKYWEEKETKPIEFINHFRCTTEPIGGGTEHDDDGELVNYDAAIAAISIAEKAIIEKACEWLSDTDFDMEYWNSENGFSKEEFIYDFKRKMEEQL